MVRIRQVSSQSLLLLSRRTRKPQLTLLGVVMILSILTQPDTLKFCWGFNSHLPRSWDTSDNVNNNNNNNYNNFNNDGTSFGHKERTNTKKQSDNKAQNQQQAPSSSETSGTLSKVQDHNQQLQQHHDQQYDDVLIVGLEDYLDDGPTDRGVIDSRLEVYDTFDNDVVIVGVREFERWDENTVSMTRSELYENYDGRDQMSSSFSVNDQSSCPVTDNSSVLADVDNITSSLAFAAQNLSRRSNDDSTSLPNKSSLSQPPPLHSMFSTPKIMPAIPTVRPPSGGEATTMTPLFAIQS